MDHLGTVLTTVYIHQQRTALCASLRSSLLLATMPASAKLRPQRLPTHFSPHQRLPTAHHR